MANRNKFFNNNNNKKRRPQRKRSDVEGFLLGTTGLVLGTVLTVEAARALGRL